MTFMFINYRWHNTSEHNLIYLSASYEMSKKFHRKGRKGKLGKAKIFYDFFDFILKTLRPLRLEFFN